MDSAKAVQDLTPGHAWPRPTPTHRRPRPRREGRLRGRSSFSPTALPLLPGLGCILSLEAHKCDATTGKFVFSPEEGPERPTVWGQHLLEGSVPTHPTRPVGGATSEESKAEKQCYWGRRPEVHSKSQPVAVHGCLFRDGPRGTAGTSATAQNHLVGSPWGPRHTPARWVLPQLPELYL